MRAAQQQAPPTERVSELIGRLKAAAADPDSPVDLASPSLSDSPSPTRSRRYRGEPSAVFDDSSESTEDSDEFEEDLLADAGLSWRRVSWSFRVIRLGSNLANWLALLSAVGELAEVSRLAHTKRARPQPAGLQRAIAAGATPCRLDGFVGQKLRLGGHALGADPTYLLYLPFGPHGGI